MDERQHDEDEVDRGAPPAPDSPKRHADEPQPPQREAVAGEGADEEDIADPERYKKGPGW